MKEENELKILLKNKCYCKDQNYNAKILAKYDPSKMATEHFDQLYQILSSSFFSKRLKKLFSKNLFYFDKISIKEKNFFWGTQSIIWYVKFIIFLLIFEKLCFWKIGICSISKNSAKLGRALFCVWQSEIWPLNCQKNGKISWDN